MYKRSQGIGVFLFLISLPSFAVTVQPIFRWSGPLSTIASSPEEAVAPYIQSVNDNVHKICEKSDILAVLTRAEIRIVNLLVILRRRGGLLSYFSSCASPFIE